MKTYNYQYALTETLAEKDTVMVGVAGSGNLAVSVKTKSKKTDSEFTISTTVSGFDATWRAVIDAFVEEYPFSGLHYVIQDAGATPSVVALRLRQAVETYQSGYYISDDYLELSARERIYAMCDPDSVHEFLVNENGHSPNLPLIGMQTANDDGVVIAKASLAKRNIAICAQQKDFIGGAVGEVHGAKINALCRYAMKHRLEAIVLLIDSGGVRLQEANVGEIEISEIIRALLEAKSQGIKTIGVICGNNGAYGGMGIISGVLDSLIVNQVARIGVSGAEVIQTVKGTEIFDASDRPLVWRVYGGRTRFLQKAAQAYTSCRVTDIKTQIIKAMDDLDNENLLNLTVLEKEQALLKKRMNESEGCSEMQPFLEKTAPFLLEQAIFTTDDDTFLIQAKGKSE